MIPSLFKTFTSLVESALGKTEWKENLIRVNLPFLILKWLDESLAIFSKSTDGFQAELEPRHRDWLAGFKKLLIVVINSLQASLNSASQGRTATDALDHLLSILKQAKTIFNYTKEDKQLNLLEQF